MEKADGKLLLELARKTLESHFSGSELDSSRWNKFNKEQGVFVTLHKHGQLRGCIGFPQPIYELKKAVMEAAKAAALDDPRFPALSSDELSDVEIEVTVLTVPEKIEVKNPSEYPEHVKVGEDGLIIKSASGSGLLLPQVFTEYKCDGVKALEMTCQKAGLDADAWKSRDVEVYKFQGNIFKE